MIKCYIPAYFRICVGLVTILTIIGSGYESVLERKKAKIFKKKYINHDNNNENDSKVEFTLEKMQAMEKMQMKRCENDDGTLMEQDPIFKGNVAITNELILHVEF